MKIPKLTRQAIFGLCIATLLAAVLTAAQPWPVKLLVDILASGLSHDAPLQMPPLAVFSSETLLFLVCIAVVVIFVIQSALDAC
jgi:hypothetical protein